MAGRTHTNTLTRTNTEPRPAGRRGIRSAILALVAVIPLTACLPESGPTVSRPEGGPFDPGQNGLPDQVRVQLICGEGIVGNLRTVSERYFDVAREWERYAAYAEGVAADGVTAEEYSGAKQRSENITVYVENYREAAEELRVTGGSITGDFVADCDREVLVRFEAIYQEREAEIVYVENETKRTTTRLRKNAGVTETDAE